MALSSAERSRKWRLLNPDGSRKWEQEHVERRAELHRKWRIENIELVREADAASKRRKRKLRKTPESRWNIENQDKKRVHAAVREAVRRGLLVKQACEICGAGRTHGHHDDYSRPLVVRWLCPVHHKTAHRRNKT